VLCWAGTWCSVEHSCSGGNNSFPPFFHWFFLLFPRVFQIKFLYFVFLFFCFFVFSEFPLIFSGFFSHLFFLFHLSREQVCFTPRERNCASPRGSTKLVHLGAQMCSREEHMCASSQGAQLCFIPWEHKLVLWLGAHVSSHWEHRLVLAASTELPQKKFFEIYQHGI